jgi:nucleotide-binding universal stress UspA family protein
MLPIQKILQPVDFSEGSLLMTAYAKALALRYGAELTLLHVVNPVFTIPPTAISGPAFVSLPEGVIEQHEKYLQEFAVEERQGVPVRRLVYEGEVVHQIAGFVQSENIDLAVMATHGHGALRRFLIGSTAAKILHDVTCPVLTGVHGSNAIDATRAFSNVLCAIDLDSHGEQTLAWASQFAADFKAALGIVHVVDSFDRASQAKEALSRLQAASTTPASTLYIETGDPAKTVCSVAKKAGADLLVIGRGTDVESSGVLSTTAYAIIRQSPCPVVSLVGLRTPEISAMLT